MYIITPNPETIKASETHNNSDIDDTATELLGLREFVVESYDIDESKQESRFYCRVQFDYWDIYPKSWTLGYCVERRLDSPREIDVIMIPGR